MNYDPNAPWPVRFHDNQRTGNRQAPLLDPPREEFSAPTVTCGTADGAWHTTDVSIACTASDEGSGLADPADASFLLTTSVAAGVETSDAQTNARTVCDNAGNCATVGPIGGIRIDRRGPSITLASPAAGTYRVNQTVQASYACSDAGSGVSSCAGSFGAGAAIPTGVPGPTRSS